MTFTKAHINAHPGTLSHALGLVKSAWNVTATNLVVRRLLTATSAIAERLLPQEPESIEVDELLFKKKCSTHYNPIELNRL